MDVDTIIKLLQNFGFPVVVAIYLLWRIDPLLRNISIAQAQQLELLRVLTERLIESDIHIGRGS